MTRRAGNILAGELCIALQCVRCYIKADALITFYFTWIKKLITGINSVKSLLGLFRYSQAQSHFEPPLHNI